MAEICEICMNIVGFWEEGVNVDYDGYVLCAKCNEKVELHREKHPIRSFKRCVRDVQKIKGRK